MAGTSYRTSHETIAMPYASCQSLVSPLAAIFRNFSLTIWVTQYFFVTARKVNSFAVILLATSSQPPFLGSLVRYWTKGFGRLGSGISRSGSMQFSFSTRRQNLQKPLRVASTLYWRAMPTLWSIMALRRPTTSVLVRLATPISPRHGKIQARKQSASFVMDSGE